MLGKVWVAMRNHLPGLVNNSFVSFAFKVSYLLSCVLIQADSVRVGEGEGRWCVLVSGFGRRKYCTLNAINEVGLFERMEWLAGMGLR